MKYDTRRLSQCYSLLIAEEPANYACEEPGKRKHVTGRSDAAPLAIEASPATPATHGSAQGSKPSSPELADNPDSGLAKNLAIDLAAQAQTLRLAMALIDGAGVAQEDRQANVDRLRIFTEQAAGRRIAPRDDSKQLTDGALIDRLQHLVRSNDRNLAEQLTLMLLIEERELWREAGCRDVLHWMGLILGIGRVSALERLRVARALRSLSVIESLFALGKLSWSKVRELTRVANPANEQALAAAALELSASETVLLCQRWRHDGKSSAQGGDIGAAGDAEARQAFRAWESRSLTWREQNTGTTRITLDLPHHSAAEFLKVLEAQEDLLREDESRKNEDASRKSESPGDETFGEEPLENQATRTPRQRRDDAALLMSTMALAHAGEPVATADRYRVLVNFDARLLAEAGTVGGIALPGEPVAERPTVSGFGPIAITTVQRLASKARLTVVATDSDGEVVATGRDTRLFSAASVKAITARDRCCQIPGCTRMRWLHAHHVVPWSEGGDTTVTNGAMLCSSCHTQLHEGRLRLERVHKDSVALADEGALTLTIDERSEARAMIAAVQRFRLVDGEGHWVAGPRRSRRGDDPYASPSSGSTPFTRVNGCDLNPDLNPDLNQDPNRDLNRAAPLSQGDQLEQYRVLRE